MKKIIPVLVLLLIATAALFAGCKSNVGMPASSDPVLGNGGLSVTKGEYVYFVNGYETYESVKTSHANKEGNVSISSIYSAKLVNGTLSDKKQLVSKVGGYEYSDLYIFGDRLYFLSPNTRKDDTGAIRSDIPSLMSVKLDGSKLEEIYTPSQYSSGNFVMKSVADKVFAIFFDGAKISVINISNKNSVSTIAEDVTSFATAFDKTTFSTEAQNYLNDNLYGNIFYTRSRNEQEGKNEGVGGNILVKYDLSNGESEIVSSNINTTITCKQVAYGRLFYTINDCYYSTDLKSASNEIRHSYVAVDSFVPVAFSQDDIKIVIKYSGKIYLQNLNDSVMPTNALIDEDLTILDNDGENLIVKDASSNLKLISTKDKTTVVLFENADTLTLVDKVDFDGRNFIMLASAKDYNSTYSYYIDYVNSVGGQKDAEIMGCLVESDKAETQSSEQ